MVTNPHTLCVRTLYEKASEASLSRVTVTTTSAYLVNLQGSGKTSSSTLITCKGSEEQVLEFQASLQSTEFGAIEIRRLGLAEGDQCPPITVWATNSGEEKTLQWTQDDQKVYLLDFWATLCDSCRPPMAHNHEMLTANPAWAGRVEILAISIDDSKDTADAVIRENNWTKVGSYWIGPGGFKAPVLVDAVIDDIPTCLLVKRGKVLWRGYPEERDLEADIAFLLDNDELLRSGSNEVAKGEKSAETFHGEELGEKLQQVDRILRDISAACPAQLSPYFVYTATTTQTATGVKQSAEAIVGGSFIRKHEVAVQQVLSQLRELFPIDSVGLSFLDTVEVIARGEKCTLCTYPFIEADTQYLCPYCEPKHYHCQACEDISGRAEETAGLAHPHKLYKITSLSDHFDELLFGANLPIDEVVSRTDRIHRCYCDNRRSPGACDGRIVGVRYKCAHCKDFDFCEGCERQFWSTAPEEWKKTMKAMGHQEYHVLLKIPFPS